MLGKIRFGEAEFFSVSVEGIALGIVTESRLLRPLLSQQGHSPQPLVVPESAGLLLGRPSLHSANSRPSWVLYESGQIVLARSQDEHWVIQAAGAHLSVLSDAIGSDLLALRLRTVVLPSGEVLLADPPSIYQTAGYDRRLRARGCLVLPTTIVAVDHRTGHVVLPELAPGGGGLPSGRLRIKQILLRDQPAYSIASANGVLALSNAVVRHASLDMRATLGQLASLDAVMGPQLQVLETSEIQQLVKFSGG